MNTSVIIASGNASLKSVGDNGQSIEIVPYVVADRPGFCSLGVAYYSPGSDEGSFWGLIMPHRLLQSWRAMKLLEQAPRIDDYVLCYCWYAASLEVRESDQSKIDDLEALFSSRDDFVRARANAIASIPTHKEMEEMLRIVHENNIELPDWELKEIRGLFSNPSPSLEEIMAMVRTDSELRSQARDAKENEDKVAAQPRSRFSWFMRLFA